MRAIHCYNRAVQILTYEHQMLFLAPSYLIATVLSCFATLLWNKDLNAIRQGGQEWLVLQTEVDQR